MASKSSLNPASLVSDYDLWVLPPSAHSRWFARVDWYLNWQMSKGLAHTRMKPSVELFRVMEDAGIPIQPEPDFPPMPLLVSSAGKVAAGRCVVVDYKNEMQDWLESIHELCSALKSKHARIFLPKGIGTGDAQKLWKKMAPLDMQLEFSTDEEDIQ
jgi:hypothetical protein